MNPLARFHDGIEILVKWLAYLRVGVRPARRRKLDLGRYVATGFSDLAPLTEVVEDATVLATGAVRLAIKNQMIVRALRDRVDFDEGVFVAAARGEFESLALENDQNALRVSRALAETNDTPGLAEHASDYHAADAPTLERRRATLLALATRLRELSTDDDLVLELVNRARYSALDEITASSAGRSESSAPVLTTIERAGALSDLANDLARMSQER